MTLDRATLNKILLKETTFADAAKGGRVSFTGNRAKFSELMSYLVDLNGFFWFNIVTP